ncbi:MAG: DNA topoisomerase IV subunit B, partial [Gemmataceae bacterium]|nr:DNA topoisomerase IV subunit B [Gemmataceae bacterium]
MRKLVEDGHVFVSRPPLFKVTQKKESRFVATRDEMTKELMARGLKDATLHVSASGGREAPDGAANQGADAPRSPRQVAGEALAKLVPVLNEVETAAVSLERRGHTLAAFLPRAKDGVFPAYHVRYAGKEYWFASADEVNAFRAEQGKKLGKELVPADDLAPGEPGAAADDATRYTLDEWHEVRALNRGLGKLKAMGFGPADLVPLPRVAGREPPVRFVLEGSSTRKELADLRGLVFEVRRLGEKGITVTRFKGLGEMDPEELWATTLDPKNRTLLRVTMTDAQRAEELFRTLMGEEVEGRKQFIMANKINNPEDIDYGA